MKQEMQKIGCVNHDCDCCKAQRKPLTQNEIRAILDNPNIAERRDRAWVVLPFGFARAIEAAHGIKD